MGLGRVVDPLVTMCVPFRKWNDWAVSFASIGPPINAVTTLRRTIKQVREVARTEMVEGCIQDRSKFVQFIDDDITVPPFLLRKLLHVFAVSDKSVAAVAGIYCTKTQPPMPAIFKKVGEGPYYDWELNRAFEVEVAPLGMMMIRTEVFHDLPKPWFADIDDVEVARSYGLVAENEHPDNASFTDDVFFCNRLRQAGYKIMAHGGCLGVHWDLQNEIAYAMPLDTPPFQKELKRRWDTEPIGELELLKRVRVIYQEVHGPTDLIPGFELVQEQHKGTQLETVGHLKI